MVDLQEAYDLAGFKSVDFLPEPEDEKGVRAWTLGNGARLYDVTHLPCRSARYTPVEADADCSPANADQDQFPVRPGGPMPAVSGCQKQDYAVLFIAAVAVDN